VALSDNDVKKVARLSRLALDDAELAKLKGQLNAIVGYVEALQEVDVEGVEPLSHAIHMEQPRRSDEPLLDVVGRRGLAGSAGYEDGLVKVPKIVE
jgi:aspartyl-tRNA(Asn)/glutamyl-tRNA(Gln) amidotransferase subunit C